MKAEMVGRLMKTEIEEKLMKNLGKGVKIEVCHLILMCLFSGLGYVLQG